MPLLALNVVYVNMFFLLEMESLSSEPLKVCRENPIGLTFQSPVTRIANIFP